MKILLDMNLSPRWQVFFVNAGMEAVHWSEVGAPDSLDSHILHHAEKNDQVILTQDLDFGNLLATSNRRNPSVVQLRTEELHPEAIGPQGLRLLLQFQEELRSGALITFDPRRTRVRILPFRQP